MCCRCAARQGRALKPGDLLLLGLAAAAAPGLAVPEAWRPTYPEAGQAWEVGVLPGPNAAPDYFTEEDIRTLYSAAYTVHYNSCAAGLGTGCLLHDSEMGLQQVHTPWAGWAPQLACARPCTATPRPASASGVRSAQRVHHTETAQVFELHRA